MKRVLFVILLLLLVLGLAGLTTTAQDTAGPPSTSGEPEQELETFVPSEKLPADTPVSFPVDI